MLFASEHDFGTIVVVRSRLAHLGGMGRIQRHEAVSKGGMAVDHIHDGSKMFQIPSGKLTHTNTLLWKMTFLRGTYEVHQFPNWGMASQTVSLAMSGQQIGSRRLEWDPLMICAPPALRYSLLAAMQVTLGMVMV